MRAFFGLGAHIVVPPLSAKTTVNDVEPVGTGMIGSRYLRLWWRQTVVHWFERAAIDTKRPWVPGYLGSGFGTER